MIKISNEADIRTNYNEQIQVDDDTDLIGGLNYIV